MGGPWRVRGYDPRAWQAPAARATARAEATRAREGQQGLVRIVVGYVATLLLSFGVMIALMKHGW